MPPSPLLTVNNTILWLKVILSAATLGWLYLRYKTTEQARPLSSGAKSLAVVLALFAFAVFQNLGTFRSGTFVHHGEMFHYYLGTKYFEELGYYDLYNAVIVADTEQGSVLASIPFYTDLKTYQNAPRERALAQADRIRNLFSAERWSSFKDDVAFFKKATGVPQSSWFVRLLMDHGYNGSPVSTFLLGILTNAVPVTQLQLLALLDVLLEIGMGLFVFRTFGWAMGGLFSVYFCVNVLNDHDYVSGSILRYDWLFCIVAAVCLLEKKRYASSAFFLTLSSMLRVFPVVLFYGMAVTIFRDVRTNRAVDRKHVRFLLAAAASALALFVLPAASLGSVTQPWQEFATNTAHHDRGVYVNHLGLRAILLFEPSHLSLEKFVERFRTSETDDIVRHWQDLKEAEFAQKRWVIVLAALFTLVCLTAIMWQRDSEHESILWPVLLIYTFSFPSHYYYGFLCLLVLLFFRRPNSLGAFVPLCLLLVLNIVCLVTDYFGPFPFVFYTLMNFYLFICMASMLGFELYTTVFGRGSAQALARQDAPVDVPPPEVKKPRRKRPQKKRDRGK